VDDAWCARLAQLHLLRLVETGEDMEKDLVTVSPRTWGAMPPNWRAWSAPARLSAEAANPASIAATSLRFSYTRPHNGVITQS
jgi:hypothetical protein